MHHSLSYAIGLGTYLSIHRRRNNYIFQPHHGGLLASSPEGLRTSEGDDSVDLCTMLLPVDSGLANAACYFCLNSVIA